MTSLTKASTSPPPPVAPVPRRNDTPEVVGDSADLLDGSRWTDRYTRTSMLSVPRTPALSVDATPAAERPGPSAAPAHPPNLSPQPPALPPPAAGLLPAPVQPRWVDGDPWSAHERTRLRRELAISYDAHARVVMRTLAEEPGLRAAGGGTDLVSDLVALCAYAADRDPVNQVLRGAHGGDETRRLIARGAVSGLRRLPTVIGPVYASSSTSVGAGYRAGDELVEPAFVDVRLDGGGVPAAAVEYVIWSVSARRVDRFTPAGQRVATFPPGSRFAVLAVDEPAADQPLRVLLRDRTGERPSNGSWREETLRRLRQCEHTTLVEQPVELGFLLGLDPQGRPFETQTAATGGGPRP